MEAAEVGFSGAPMAYRARYAVAVDTDWFHIFTSISRIVANISPRGVR